MSEWKDISEPLKKIRGMFSIIEQGVGEIVKYEKNKLEGIEKTIKALHDREEFVKKLRKDNANKNNTK